LAEGEEDKTERATPHRRNEARKKGQVCLSREVGGVGMLLAVLLVLYFLSGTILQGLMGIVGHYLTGLPAGDIGVSDALRISRGGIVRGAMLFLPLMAAAFLVSVGAVVAQVGVAYTPEALGLRFEKLNPASGLTRLVSSHSVFGLVTSLLKLVVIAVICWLSIRDEVRVLLRLPFGTPATLVQATGAAVFAMSLRIVLAMAAIALLDWCWQKWQYEKNLRMTKQEVKDEAKLLEGDPRSKARIRRAQMEMARKRMMAAARTADVVVRNPTHYAVALKYDKASMAAPEVVAKGANFMARRILEVAARYQIPIVTDPPLAQTLYRTVQVGHRIPVQLYRAVARILAQIYRSRRLRQGAPA